MKRKLRLIISLLWLSIISVQAQTFIGTMAVGNYTKKNVTVQLQPSSNPKWVSVTLYGVKFAKLMPVKLDVKIDAITNRDGLLTGDSIIPTNKDKCYEKYLVRHLQGAIDKDSLRFACQMGKKQLNYSGMIMK